MGKNIMIYGSCVSRDAYELLGPEYNLLSYVARQSMISATSKPTDLLDGTALTSGFQNRSLAGDLKSNLLPTLRRYVSQIDVLLIDLTDERLGVIQLPDGSYVTRSHELVSSGRLADVQGEMTVLNFGTDEFVDLWLSSSGRVLRSVDSLGLREKTLIINTPWASTSDCGNPVPEFRATPTAEVNESFAVLIESLRRRGYRVADLPAEYRRSTTSHKWGSAPYHFVPEASEWIAAQVIEIASI